MASRGEAREYETRRNLYHKKHRFAVSFRFISSFQGSVSFCSTIFRFGMTNRIVKDCRVGRTRPPRNDKTGRFCIRRKKSLTFVGENGRPREPLNKSAAALSGPFAPTYRFENLESRIPCATHTRIVRMQAAPSHAESDAPLAL